MSLPIRIWLGPLLRWLRSLSRSMRVHLVSTRPAPYPSAETERQARDPVLRAAGDWPVHRYEHRRHHRALAVLRPRRDRKSVVWGKSVSVRVDLGGRRIIK